MGRFTTAYLKFLLLAQTVQNKGLPLPSTESAEALRRECLYTASCISDMASGQQLVTGATTVESGPVLFSIFMGNLVDATEVLSADLQVVLNGGE